MKPPTQHGPMDSSNCPEKSIQLTSPILDALPNLAGSTSSEQTTDHQTGVVTDLPEQETDGIFQSTFWKLQFFQDVTNGLCFSDKPLKLTASPQAVMSRLPSTDENSSALVLYCIACCALSVKHNWLKVDDFDFYYKQIIAKRSRTGLLSLHVLFWR